MKHMHQEMENYNNRMQNRPFITIGMKNATCREEGSLSTGKSWLVDTVKGESPEDESILALCPFSSALMMDQHYPAKRWY
jgi:hypothetical protein